MQLFATYTFGQALLTVLELPLLFLWIWLAITVVIDVFAATTCRAGRRPAGLC